MCLWGYNFFGYECVIFFLDLKNTLDDLIQAFHRKDEESKCLERKGSD